MPWNIIPKIVELFVRAEKPGHALAALLIIMISVTAMYALR
ncbi:hypothetical protein [Novosphingobium sp.]|nr:hypothetical protein [Novosphingobium sp.]